MKKLFILLIVLTAVFSFGTGAFAQTAPVVTLCSTTTIGTLPCYQSDQGICTYFDFQTGYGYSPAGRPGDDSRAIFQICNCPTDPRNFGTGSKIGVRMTILVDGRPGENGAYWSLPADGNVHFGMNKIKELACEGEPLNSFGPGHFYRLSDLTTPVSIIGDTTCQVPSANRATVLVTDATAGYVITRYDETEGLARWFVQIPPIRIDPAILHNGEVIQVKVEFLRELNEVGGYGICPNCPSVCAGEIIDVARVGSSSCTSCTYAIVPTSSLFEYSGGQGSVAVTTANSSCSWSAVSNASWITIGAGSMGIGSGTVTYSVSANKTGSSRVGTITIAGKTFPVTQDKNVSLPPLILLLD